MAALVIGLVYALGIGLIAATAGVLALALLGRRDAKELLAARDVLEKLDEQFDALEVDRNGLKVEIDSERTKTKTLTDRVAVAEAQRNEAQRRERDHVIERIKSAKVADANRIIADLLSTPLADSVPQAVSRSAQPTSGDGLMDPAEL